MNQLPETRRIPARDVKVGDDIAVHPDSVPSTVGKAPGAAWVTVTAALTDEPANLVHLNTETGGYHVIATDHRVLTRQAARNA